MELHDFFRIVQKRWIVIVIAVVLGVGVAVSYVVTTAPTYAASTQVVVATNLSPGASTSDLVQGANYSRSQVKTYVQLVTQPLVLEPVVEQLGLDEDAASLATHVTASNPIDTTIVKIQVTDGAPVQAQALANAVATSFTAAIEDLETQATSGTSRVSVTTAAPAELPTEPASPKPMVALALGVLVGLLAGVGVAVVMDLTNTRVRGTEDVKRVTDASIIGVIPTTGEVKRSPLVVYGDPHGVRAEACRRLRANLQFVDVVSASPSLVITSSVPGEGKTTTAINLATTMAAAGMRVCLVEADLRRPRLARNLGLEGAVGLTSVLIGRVGVEAVLQRWAGQRRLRVLPCGMLPPNPTELVGSDAMRAVIGHLESTFDSVIIDVPPLLPVIDGALLATMTGGAALIVGAGKVHREQVARAIESLGAVDAKLLGVVMTMVSKGEDQYTYATTYAPDAQGHG